MANLKLQAYEQNPTKIKFVINQLSTTLDEISKLSGNVVLYGADNTGTVACDAAISAALAASSILYFPPGIYTVSAAIAITLTAGKSIIISGAGSQNTILRFNATSGIVITLGSVNASFHIRDLTLTTSGASVGSAIAVVGPSVAVGFGPQSDISNVTICGDDFVPGTAGGSHCWNTSVNLTLASFVLLLNVNTFGLWGAPLSAGGGVGLRFAGISPVYAVTLNVISCSFNNHATAVILGSYWQGIMFRDCNFNGTSGTAAIQQGGGAAGTLSGLWIIGCQFNTGGYQIFIGTNINDLRIVGNTITTATASVYGVDVGGSLYCTVQGNFFNLWQVTPPAGTTALHANGANGTFTGNVIQGHHGGVNLDTASSLWTVALNSYTGVTTPTANTGTNNSVGGAAAGAMAGVVP